MELDMTERPSDLSASEAARRILDGALMPTGFLEDVLARIKETEPTVKAYRTVYKEAAAREASEREAEVRNGTIRGPLHGVPVAIKDLFAEAGKPNPAGCAAYAEEVARADSAAVARLREAGAVVLGRTAMDELAYGVTGANPHYGPVANPRRPECVAGGSSAGSAAAVAARSAPVALGTDTAGSVRIPAALCGVVGLKPTRERCDRTGILPLSHTLDHVGVLASSVEDAALMLGVLGRTDSCTGREDADRGELGARLREALSADPKGLKVGVAKGFALEAADAVVRCFEKAVQILAELGVVIEEVEIPELGEAPRAIAPVIGYESALFHRDRLKNSPEGFSPTVTGYLNKGMELAAWKYEAAVQKCDSLRWGIGRAMESYDALISPTTAVPAGPIESPPEKDLDLLALTCPFNATYQPAISVPMGEADGLPVGLQIAGRLYDEETVVCLAQAFVRASS